MPNHGKYPDELREREPPRRQPGLTVRGIYEEWPQLKDLFREIAQAFDMDTMQQLNSDVDVEGFDPDQVAEDWMRGMGFIG